MFQLHTPSYSSRTIFINYVNAYQMTVRSLTISIYCIHSRAAGPPYLEGGGGGHLGTTFSIIYQIKAYYLSCSETFVSVVASRGDLRKPHVSMATNIRLIIQINGTMKMHFSCSKNSRKNCQHLMML